MQLSLRVIAQGPEARDGWIVLQLDDAKSIAQSEYAAYVNCFSANFTGAKPVTAAKPEVKAPTGKRHVSRKQKRSVRGQMHKNLPTELRNRSACKLCP